MLRWKAAGVDTQSRFRPGIVAEGVAHRFLIKVSGNGSAFDLYVARRGHDFTEPRSRFSLRDAKQAAEDFDSFDRDGGLVSRGIDPDSEEDHQFIRGRVIEELERCRRVRCQDLAVSSVQVVIEELLKEIGFSDVAEAYRLAMKEKRDY